MCQTEAPEKPRVLLWDPRKNSCSDALGKWKFWFGKEDAEKIEEGTDRGRERNKNFIVENRSGFLFWMLKNSFGKIH